MENKDLYVIEIKNRIKVGVTFDFNSRISNIKTTAGLKNNEILNLYHFSELSSLESRIKRLFSKQKINGEWFYKKEIVLDFLKELEIGRIPSTKLLSEIKNNSVKYQDVFKIGDIPYEYYEIIKNNAINLLEKIKSERKGIGFPDSVELNRFIKTKRASYRNMSYYSDENFLTFERKPNFKLESITNNQLIECLRIIKNITPNNKEKDVLQDYIDSVFSKNMIYIEKCIAIVESFFFLNPSEKNARLEIDSNIYQSNYKIEYDNESEVYSFSQRFDDLEKDELMFLKKSKSKKLIISILGDLSFDYKNSLCFCFFKVENFLKVLNFFEIEKIEDKGIRLFFNNTDKYDEYYVFEFKYHLLNEQEKQFIDTLEMVDAFYYYIEFKDEKNKYYCIVDDLKSVKKELEYRK